MQSLASEAPLLIKNEGGPRCGNGSMSVKIPQLVHVCCHVASSAAPWWSPPDGARSSRVLSVSGTLPSVAALPAIDPSCCCGRRALFVLRAPAQCLPLSKYSLQPTAHNFYMWWAQRLPCVRKRGRSTPALRWSRLSASSSGPPSRARARRLFAQLWVQPSFWPLAAQLILSAPPCVRCYSSPTSFE